MIRLTLLSVLIMTIGSSFGQKLEDPFKSYKPWEIKIDSMLTPNENWTKFQEQFLNPEMSLSIRYIEQLTNDLLLAVEHQVEDYVSLLEDILSHHIKDVDEFIESKDHCLYITKKRYPEQFEKNFYVPIQQNTPIKKIKSNSLLKKMNAKAIS